MTGSNRYDAVRYPGRAYEFSHPDRLAIIARLRGLEPPNVSDARVLEIGCGDGLNILGIASSLPDAHCVGVDVCAEPLIPTRSVASALGVTNLELRAVDLADLVDSGETYDFIIAHGVFSWVPDPTRRALMDGIRRLLSPRGIALASYNCLPGWHFRGIAREVVLATFGRPPQRHELSEVRAVVHEVAGQLQGAGLYGAVLEELTTYVDQCTDASLYHDVLSPDCDAFGFRDFATYYQRVGLQYIGDAIWADGILSGYPPAFQKMLARFENDPIGREQLVDVMRNSLFRRPLLTLGGPTVSWTPAPGMLAELHVHLRGVLEGQDEAGERYRADSGHTLVVSDPVLRRAMLRLHEVAPGPVKMDEFLADDLGELARLTPLIIQAYAAHLIELLPRRRPFSGAASQHPESYPLARWQTAGGASEVINCCHEMVELGAIDQILVNECDGTRTREGLVDALVRRAQAGDFNILVDDVAATGLELQREAIDGRIDARLRDLRNAGLLATCPSEDSVGVTTREGRFPGS